MPTAYTRWHQQRFPKLFPQFSCRQPDRDAVRQKSGQEPTAYCFCCLVLLSTEAPAMKAICPVQSLLLQPTGSLDLHAGNDLQQQIVKGVSECKTLLALDLSQIDFIDAAGLSALVKGLSFAKENCCRLAVCNPSPTVRLVFEITQLDRVLEIFSSYEEIPATVAISRIGRSPLLEVAA